MLCVVVAVALANGCGDEGSDKGAPLTGNGAVQARGDSPNHRRDTPERAGFECDPAEASRPDKPRGKAVAGVTAPPIPRRTCTLPQNGCVAPRGRAGPSSPPVPGVKVSRVTEHSIEVVYNVGSDLSACQPAQLRVTVHTTASGLPPYGDDYRVSGPTGRLRVERKRVSRDTDYGPPDILVVSSETAKGLSSESATVGLPPPRDEKRLSDAEARRITARREACRADINDRTSCSMGARVPVSGPVTQGTPRALSRSVRQSLGAYGGGFTIRRLKCVNRTSATRCDVAFTTSDGRHRLEMSYDIQALKSAPTCWQLSAFRVTRPVPKLGGFAAPLPNRGCADR